jgi:hypothetical protein
MAFSLDHNQKFAKVKLSRRIPGIYTEVNSIMSAAPIPRAVELVTTLLIQISDPQYTWLKEGEFLSHAVGEGDRLKISVYRASSSPKARMK